MEKMKGLLYKTEGRWGIQYKMYPDLIATDGGLIPITPDQDELLLVQILNIPVSDFEGKEVEFEMEQEWPIGSDKPIIYAKIIGDNYDISDEEIKKAAFDEATFAPSFIRGAQWYREQLKNKNK